MKLKAKKCFNSTLVRLKQGDKKWLDLTKQSFNSTLVRLKLFKFSKKKIKNAIFNMGWVVEVW